MKLLVKLLLFLIISCPSLAQNYGNEWINYSQQYYAFNVYQTGIFRLDQTALTAASIPTGSFSSANIQIFGREKEIPLLIVDGNDNSFDPGDYILFYAQRNDGWIDSLIYRQPGDIANPGYSLYNDTIQYFFTWNSSTSNKRFVPDPGVDFTNYTPANYVLKDAFSAGSALYSEGYKQDKASGSIYAPGEGWGLLYEATSSTSGDGLQIVNMPTYNLYTSPDAPQARLHVSTVSNSSALVNFPNVNNHHLRMDVGESSFPLIDTVFAHYKMIKFDRSLPLSVFNNGTTPLNFRIINDLGVAVDRISLNYYRLTYPRATHSNGSAYDDFSVPFNNAGPKTLINLQGFTAATPVILAFGATPTAVTAVSNAGNWQFLVPNAGGGNPCRVIAGDLANAIPVSGLEAVNGTGQFTDFSALSMDAAYLMVYHPALQTATAAYANYRGSLPGGGNNVVLANIHELYQQYGGGVEKHVIAIRRFALHAYHLAVTKPGALFLVGKGISEYGGTRQSAAHFAQSLIPSFGYPSSDIAITAGLAGTNWDPLIPTGRISVTTNTGLQNYLDKVIQYESVQGPNSPSDNDWQKQVLHFVGGSNTQQQTTFANFMNAMAGVLEDSLYFAGHVNSYYKTSSDPLDPNVVAGVTERISSGVSLMNFFGHAAASNNGFEINIDEPSNWNNTGKYPIVIGNSCYNGNIFGPSLNSTSENFVNLSNEGAIAFISTTFVGYDSPLNTYSNRLYQHFSELSYGETVGRQMQSTIRDIQVPDPQHTQTILETTSTQMTLHGDPALKLNWHTDPEIEITASGLYFEPTNLNLTVDTIDLYLIVKNLGKSVTEPFNVQIRRNFPGTPMDSVYNITVPFLNFSDTVHFRFPMQPNIGLGENQFTVTADLPSFIAEEHDESGNNQVSKTLFIRVDGIVPVYPYDFAVVPGNDVTVKASTIDPIAAAKSYLFELDTVPYYNSPQYRKFSLTDIGGVKEVRAYQWKNALGNPFPLVCQDSTVYFWRVAVDSSVPVWTEYSFQYIAGKTGWGQDHFFQFGKNDFYGLDHDTLNRQRTFGVPEAHEVEIDVYNYVTFYSAWYIDNDFKDYGCLFGGAPALYVFVIDPVTLQPWRTRFGSENPDYGFGNGNDNPTANPGIGQGTASDAYFAFNQSDPAQLAAFSNMIENEIPDGHYVGIYTTPSALYSTWDALYPPIYSTFQNTIGSTLVNNTQPQEPFALFYRNGSPASLVEKHYPDTVAGGKIQLTATIYESDYSGLERTPLIGPSANWETIFWKRDSLELFSSDSVRLYIEVFDSNRAQQLTIDTVFSPDDSFLQVNNLFPAAQYPYIRLAAYCNDAQFFTPAQVDRLHVLYQPVPEAAIDGSSVYFINPLTDTLREGQDVAFAADVRNISAYDMDSLLIRYWIEDANRVRHYIPYERQDSLRAGEVMRDTIHFSTLNYAGLNSLWMEVNPYVNGSAIITDQPEQYHFNNLLQLPLYVSEDDVHPILDVTFNGRHILNKDIVDPESEILITLKDDNPWLIMSQDADTSLFGIYVTDPAGVQRRIPFVDQNGNQVMQWVPAVEGQNNKFRIVYPADFTMDGMYTLFIQGTDKSGNISGDIEYRISFEIIHESSITYMMNYPNPFSTSTRFIFTLTGSEEPDDMIIQIMTVTGRVVREITESEIGRITIGRNISEYAWDGTDEFGDPLANGVYLYRVKAKINGEDIKHRESGADSHFKKEFGKMYLMR